MAVLYLRFLIGGAAAAFVALVAVATLGLSITIAFRTLRDNAEQSVARLGAATAVTTDAFFAAPELRLKAVASFPKWAKDGATMPTDDAAFVPGQGGPTLEKWRRTLVGFAVTSRFTEFANDVVFLDGSACRTFPIVAPAPIYGTLCGIPNGTAMAKELTVHDIPTGHYNPVFTQAFLPLFANLHPPSLLVPAYAALWEQWLQSTPDGDIRWAAPVGINSAGTDYFVVSAMTRILNATGRIGMTAVHISLADIGKILTAAKLTSHTEVFVYDQDGFLMGASSGIGTFAAENFTGLDTTPGCTTTAASVVIQPSDVQRRMCRYHLTKAPYAPLAASAQSDAAFFSGATTAGTVRLIKGNYVFTQRLPTLTGAQRLFLATVTPESDVLGAAETILPISAGVTAGIVVFIAALSFVLVWVVLRPLQGIAERMGKAARLEEDTSAVDVSPIAEIGDLQRAFVEMRDELSRIRAFVPQALLRAATDEDDEEPGADVMEFDTVSSCASVPQQGGKPLAYQTSRVPTDPSDGTQSSMSMSMRSGTTARRGRDGDGKRTLARMTGTRREAVAVLCVNLRGFHAATERGLDGEKIAAVVDAVLAAAQRERGVVDSFHGDRFMVTFNAVKPCANHGIRATLTAAHIAARLGGDIGEESVLMAGASRSTLSTSQRPLQCARSGAYDLPVTCGVAVGMAQVGSLGSAAMKSFAVVGPVVSQAALLERMCKLYPGAQCLVPQRLFADLATAVRLRTVDLVRLPFAQKPCLVADVLGEHPQGGGDDEWMYQLHAQENHGRGGDGASRVDALNTSNNTWSLLAEGRMGDAVASFAKLPADRATGGHLQHAKGTSEHEATAPEPVAVPTVAEHLAAVIDIVRAGSKSSAATESAAPVRELGLFYKAVTET